MDRELRYLIYAANLIGAHITPTLAVNAAVVLTAGDVAAVSEAVTRTVFSSVDGNRVRSLLGVGYGRPRPVTLSWRDTVQLTATIRRLHDAAEREKRIARGQYTRPMSPSEAVKFMRGRGGR